MAAKVFTYLVIMIGLVLGFVIMGINIEGQNAVLNITGVSVSQSNDDLTTFTSASLSVSDLFRNIFSTTVIIGILAGLGLAIGGGIVTSLTGGRYSVENFIILPFITGVLVLFFQVFVGMITHSIASGQAWVAALAVLMITPVSVGFLISLVEFFRGND